MDLLAEGKNYLLQVMADSEIKTLRFIQSS